MAKNVIKRINIHKTNKYTLKCIKENLTKNLLRFLDLRKTDLFLALICVKTSKTVDIIDLIENEKLTQ